MLFFQDKTLKNLNLTSLFEGGGPPAGGGRSSPRRRWKESPADKAEGVPPQKLK